MLCSRIADEVPAESTVCVMIEQGPFVALFVTQYCCRAILILGSAKNFIQAEKDFPQTIKRGLKNFDYSDALAILYLERNQGKKMLHKSL